MGAAAFEDCKGRKWELRLTVADLKPLRELGFDAAGLMTAGERLGEVMFGDPAKLAAVLYRLSRATVTEDEFAEGLDGPAMEAGGVALLESLIDFFPRSRPAQSMRGKVREALDRMDDRLISLLDSNAAAGNSPASAASTPAA